MFKYICINISRQLYNNRKNKDVFIKKQKLIIQAIKEAYINTLHFLFMNYKIKLIYNTMLNIKMIYIS